LTGARPPVKQTEQDCDPCHLLLQFKRPAHALPQIACDEARGTAIANSGALDASFPSR
jgi:hypothetical protein